MLPTDPQPAPSELSRLLRLSAPDQRVARAPFTPPRDDGLRPLPQEPWPAAIDEMFATLPADDDEITARRDRIRADLLANSQAITSPQFTRITGTDLVRLFEGYDHAFFAGGIGIMLSPFGQREPDFAFSGRLRKSAGQTRRRDSRSRGNSIRRSFEIQISKLILFSTFKDDTPAEFVCGRACTDRVDALMRILEHEFLHLFEFLVCDRSSCSGRLFQHLAHGLFRHKEMSHSIVSRHEAARLRSGLRPGDRVRFWHEGGLEEGTINRITRRATVLVESERGVPYTDGKRYLKFYVPLARLELVKPTG